MIHKRGAPGHVDGWMNDRHGEDGEAKNAAMG